MKQTGDDWSPDLTELCPHGRHLTAVCLKCGEEMEDLESTKELNERFTDTVIFDGESEFKDVHRPRHYTVGGYEAIDVIKAKLTPEEFRGYLKGNQLKYLMRANYKDHHDQDIEKSAWYGNRLVEELREQHLNRTTERIASNANGT